MQDVPDHRQRSKKNSIGGGRSHRYRYPQKRRWNRSLVRLGALILPEEQLLQLLLQLCRLSVLFGGVEGVHGGAVVEAESVEQRRGRVGVVEGEGVADEGDVLLRRAGGG